MKALRLAPDDQPLAWYSTPELCRIWRIKPNSLSHRLARARRLGYPPSPEQIRQNGRARARRRPSRLIRGDYAVLLDRLSWIARGHAATLGARSSCPTCHRGL